MRGRFTRSDMCITMNIHTTMLLAASNLGDDPNSWVQVRHSMMDSTLPWQDPDGVFVGLVESAAGWTPTLDYNGAGGVNNSFSTMVAWKTASITAVLPNRTGAAADWAGKFPEFIARLAAIPADSAAWQPDCGIGIMVSSNSNATAGTGVRCTTATQSGARSLAATGGNTAVTTAVTASYGNVLPRFQPNFTANCTAQPRQVDGTVVVTNGVLTGGAPGVAKTTSEFIVGFGNDVSSPAAGNRTITVQFYTRVYDLPFNSFAPASDATGWNVYSPADFGSPGTPTSDPGSLLGGFDTSSYPEWLPDFDDNGSSSLLDGYTEGTLWANATLPGNASVEAPLFIGMELTTAPAYAISQFAGITAGFSDPTSTGSALVGYQFGTAGNYRSNAVIFNANTTSAITPVAVGLGSFGYWSAQSDGTTHGGGIAGAVCVDGSGAITTSMVAQIRSQVFTSPRFSVCMTKDTTALGTSNTTIGFFLWYSTIPGYQFQWPA